MWTILMDFGDVRGLLASRNNISGVGWIWDDDFGEFEGDSVDSAGIWLISRKTANATSGKRSQASTTVTPKLPQNGPNIASDRSKSYPQTSQDGA